MADKGERVLLVGGSRDGEWMDVSNFIMRRGILYVQKLDGTRPRAPDVGVMAASDADTKIELETYRLAVCLNGRGFGCYVFASDNLPDVMEALILGYRVPKGV